MVAIFSYGFDIATQNFADAHVKLVCLSNYEALLPRALQQNYINDKALESLNEWRKDPSLWSPS